MKFGNNDTAAPWHVRVRSLRREPVRWKFYAGYSTQEEAEAVAADRNTDAKPAGEFLYTVAPFKGDS